MEMIRKLRLRELQSLSKVTGLLKDESRIRTQAQLVLFQGFLFYCMVFSWALSHLLKGGYPEPVQGSARASASSLPAAFGWSPASKTFHTALPDSSLKHPSFSTLLCHSTTSTDTMLTRGKICQRPQIQLLVQGGNTHFGSRNPSSDAWPGRAYDRGPAWSPRWLSALKSLPALTTPKLSRHHTLYSFCHGWTQKNLHQGLGEPFVRNVRKAHRERTDCMWGLMNHGPKNQRKSEFKLLADELITRIY